MKNLELLKKYVDAAAPSGYEKEARIVMKEHLSQKDIPCEQDNLGSLIAKIGDHGPKIMLAGHLDEIGFMVTKIDDNGYISFTPLGGWWGQVMLAQQMDVVTRDGKRHRAIIGAKPPHMLSVEERAKPVAIDKMFLDLGVSSKEEVEALNISIGDYVVPYCEFQTMGNEKYMLAKAWDNRVGCYIASEVILRLKDEALENQVYAVGTVQEEVGLRGAKTAAHMINPDIGISLDVGLAADMPGLESEVFKGKLGDGPLITLFDSSMIGHRDLRDFIVDVAKENDIKFQFAGLKAGGTDAGEMHKAHNGAPSIAIGLATRYIHSNVGIIHYDDIENAIVLLTKVVKKLNEDTVKEITFK